MDVFHLIREGHDELRGRLEVLIVSASMEPQESGPIIRDLIERFAAHHEAEERVLFSRLMRFEQVRSVIDEAWEEHAAIDLYLQRIKRSHSSVRWPAKTVVLRDLVELHMAREENRVFPAVEKWLGNEWKNLAVEFGQEEEKRLALPQLA